MQITEKVSDNFHSRVLKTQECWIWIGSIDSYGYGRMHIGNNKWIKAHRLAWMMYKKEELDPKLALDHLCRVRNCVYPPHLEQVTRGENALRGDTITYKNTLKHHCPKGHKYNKINSAGRRVCTTCMNEHSRLYKIRKKQYVETK